MLLVKQVEEALDEVLSQGNMLCSYVTSQRLTTIITFR